MDFGNPGKEYEKTRHNVGFRTIDIIANKLDIDISKKKFDALVGEGFINGEKILLVKPQTYMNLSGVAISGIVDFYQLDLEKLIVIYDDIDIESGKIKIRKSGSAGTHNGMKNITQMLASEEFPRIRIGIDKPQYEMSLVDYVLKPLTKEDETMINKGIEKAVSAAIKMIDTDIQNVMNEFNGN